MPARVSIRLATDGKPQVVRDFADIGDAGDAGAKRISSSFNRAANDADAALARLQKASERMASIAPTASGATNTINPLTGGGYDQGMSSARASAAAMQQQYAAAEQGAQRLLASIDPLYAAQLRYDQALEQANMLYTQGALTAEQLARVQTGLKAQLDGATVGLGGFRAASGTARIAQMELMGAARGMTDALAMGMPITRAISIEMGRLTEAAAIMGGSLGKIGAFMSTGWGIAAVLAVNSLVPFITKLIETGNATDTAVEKLKKQAEQERVNDDANRIFAGTVDGVTEALRKNQDAVDKLAESDKSAAQRALDVATAEAKKADALRRSTVAILQQQEANLRNAQAVNFGAGGGASAYGAQSFFQQQVDAAAAAVTQAQADVIAAGNQQLQAFALITADMAAKDPVDKIKEHYKQMIDAATQRATQEALAAKSAGDQARAQALVTTELNKQVTALQQQSDAAVKAYEAAHRKPASETSIERQGGSAIDIAQIGAFLDIANKYRGDSERSDKAVLEAFFRAANENLDPEKVAWCAAFVNAVLHAGGVHGTGSLAASSFLTYGKDDTHSPQRGDVVVVRSGGSQLHVGFLDSIDAKGNVSMVAGNTGNKVAESTYSATNVLAIRRPPTPAEEATDQAHAADQAQKDLEEAQRQNRDAFAQDINQGLRQYDEEQRKITENIAQRAAEYQKVVEQQQTSGQLLQAEIGMVGLSAEQRKEKLDLLRQELDLQYKLGPEYTDRIKQVIAEAAAQDELRRHLEQIEATFDDLRQTGDQVLEDLFNPDNWNNWADLGKKVLHDLEFEFIKLAALNPLKNMLFGENLSTLGSLFSAFAGTPSIPTLDIPAFGTGINGGNAVGTQYFGGGTTWVGEFGKELVQLPKGSKIMPARDSQRVAANDAGIGSITIPIAIDATGADAAGLARVEAQLDALQHSLPGIIIATWLDARERNKFG